MIFARGAISMTLSPRFHLSFDSDEEALGHKTVGKEGASAAAGKKVKCGELLGLDPKGGENWTLKVAGTKEHLCDDGLVSCESIPLLYSCNMS